MGCCGSTAQAPEEPLPKEVKFFDGDGVCYAFWCEEKALWRSVDGKPGKVAEPLVFDVDGQGFGDIWDGSTFVCSTSRKNFDSIRPLAKVGGIECSETQKK